MKKFSTGCAIALLATACSLAVAQDATTKNQDSASRKAARTEQRENRQENRQEKKVDRALNEDNDRTTVSDRIVTEYFAGKLMLMGQSTIELSKIAEQRSTNPQVKEFAKMLVDEHTECRQKLQERAPEIANIINIDGKVVTRTAGFRGATDADNQADADKRTDANSQTDADQKPDTNEKTRSAARKAARNPDDTETLAEDGDVDPHDVDRPKRLEMIPVNRILSIERQATNNYVQSSSEMLNKYDGQDFDMGFLGFTIGSHTWALAELKAMDSVGDEKFQQLISEATTKTEQHLKRAQELSKQFENDSTTTRGQSRPEDSTEKARVPK